MPSRSRLHHWFVAALIVIATAALATAEEWREVTRVVDGDTIVLDGGERVRLIGVDTPETVHPTKPVEHFGREASDFTKSRAEGERVRIEYDSEGDQADRYGRTLAYVWLEDGTLLNQEIIEKGYGFAYTRFPFSRMEEFRESERKARAGDVGLWADDGDAGEPDEEPTGEDEQDAEPEIDPSNPRDDEHPNEAGILELPSASTVVGDSQFGQVYRSTHGDPYIYASDTIPTIPNTEFGWVIQLQGDGSTLWWSEEVSGPTFEPTPSEVHTVSSDGRIGNSWIVEEKDPPGDYRIEVNLGGKETVVFNFQLVAPVPMAIPDEPQSRLGAASPPASCIPASQCCKICSAGQACGNSCISASYTCHKGVGCACDAVVVCR